MEISASRRWTGKYRASLFRLSGLPTGPFVAGEKSRKSQRYARALQFAASLGAPARDLSDLSIVRDLIV